MSTTPLESELQAACLHIARALRDEYSAGFFGHVTVYLRDGKVQYWQVTKTEQLTK